MNQDSVIKIQNLSKSRMDQSSWGSESWRDQKFKWFKVQSRERTKTWKVEIPNRLVKMLSGQNPEWVEINIDEMLNKWWGLWQVAESKVFMSILVKMSHMYDHSQTFTESSLEHQKPCRVFIFAEWSWKVILSNRQSKWRKNVTQMRNYSLQGPVIQLR